MAPREKWTDGGLEDLSQRVDEGFADLGKQIDVVDKRVGTLEIKSEGLENKVDEGFGRLDRDIRELRGEIKGMNRGMWAGVITIVAALIGTSAFS